MCPIDFAFSPDINVGNTALCIKYIWLFLNAYDLHMSTLILMFFFIKPFLPLRNEDLNERLIDVQLILLKR